MKKQEQALRLESIRLSRAARAREAEAQKKKVAEEMAALEAAIVRAHVEEEELKRKAKVTGSVERGIIIGGHTHDHRHHYANGTCRASLALIDSRFLVGKRCDHQPIKTIFFAVFLKILARIVVIFKF